MGVKNLKDVLFVKRPESHDVLKPKSHEEGLGVNLEEEGEGKRPPLSASRGGLVQRGQKSPEIHNTAFH